MMQSFSLMALITVLWELFGYRLCIRSGNRLIGGHDYLFLRGVGAQPDPDYAAMKPQETFMVFRLMFAIISLALITGAFAAGNLATSAFVATHFGAAAAASGGAGAEWIRNGKPSVL